MAKRPTPAASNRIDLLPCLPLDDCHWQAIFAKLGLSPQQVKIVALVLRSAGTREIAVSLGISEPTVKTYLQRVFTRLNISDRMGLAMRVLAISHEIGDIANCRSKE